MSRFALRPLRVALSAAFVIGLLAPSGAVAATDRLPDLRMAPLSNFYTENSAGEVIQHVQQWFVPKLGIVFVEVWKDGRECLKTAPRRGDELGPEA